MKYSMTTVTERNFGKAFLGDIVNWIAMDMEPDEVFRIEDLVCWIKEELEPEDVYSYDALADWAEANGFIKVD